MAIWGEGSMVNDLGLTQLAEGVWLDAEPVDIVGMPLSVNMAVLQLSGGDTLLYSPISYSEERRRAIEAIGPIGHLYAPSLFHHRRIGDWAAALPQAKVHAPAGLRAKYPALRIDREVPGSAEPAFAQTFDEITILGCRLGETVLLHRPSRTLVVADLLQNVGRPQHPWTKFYSKLMGFYDRVALSRALRWTAFADTHAARQSLRQLTELEFDRIVVGHGAPVEVDAKRALATAFAWLNV